MRRGVVRVLVTGSRGWKNEQIIERALADCLNTSAGDVVLVQGGCRKGADAIAGRVAKRLGIKIETHHADWDKYGRAAGPIRNSEMLNAEIDLCLAFWDGESPGTSDTVRKARQKGIPLEVFRC